MIGGAFTLPMLLTYGRILAIPAVVIAMLQPGTVWYWVSFVIFVAACVTDYFDGMIARARQQVTALGALLDPIADKLLVAATLILLPATDRVGDLAVIAVLLIISRELMVSGLREFGATQGIAIPVTQLAKWKTTVQMTAIAVLIAGAPALAPLVGQNIAAWVKPAGETLLWIATVLTWVTGWDYLSGTLRHLNEPPRR
ncbi:MAG: CDP-diacylglycerol--glycerol-3-phosphate 3-phosphatidyltransferase [Alphaproteobacteria bacterium]|nr:CDP-diacylglycerol--glycerol-3-phosphate 3-phosphatidyltransferase [Alphaproteobacteria bacterium]